MYKFAIEMHMPEGKRAGYYAQIIKALAGKTRLFDREKELLIFSTYEEAREAIPVLEQYSVPYEEITLILLPSTAQVRPSFSDFGFISRMENMYVYAALVRLFYLKPIDGTNSTEHVRIPEPQLAIMQLEEYILAESPGNDPTLTLYAVETQHGELIERIARAYGCDIFWID